MTIPTTNIPPHRVTNGDIMNLNTLHTLMRNEKAALMYTDPPWGQGALSMWLTLNTKQTGAPRAQINHTDFLDRLLTIARTWVEGYVVIEYGTRWKQELLTAAARHGLIHLATAETRYRTGNKLRPLHVHAFHTHIPDALTRQQKTHWVKATQGTHGYDTCAAAGGYLALPDHILLDPLCGKGYSARLAQQTNMRFRGNEINAARLQHTIARLQQ